MRSEFKVGVFGIVFNEKKEILLCHRKDYDLWNLPGGILESGESVTDCVVRETKEETGLDVKISRLAGVYTKPEKNEIVFSFVCEIIGGKITLSDEADKIDYFEVDKLPDNTVPKQVERIKDAIENLEETVFKKQTGKSSIELVREGKL